MRLPPVTRQSAATRRLYAPPVRRRLVAAFSACVILLVACGGDGDDHRPATTVSDLGLPYGTVPATFGNQLPEAERVPKGAKDCGYEISAPGVWPRIEPIECLRDAWAACEPAMLQFIQYTIEGAPIASTLLVDEQSPCVMRIRVDSRDHLGSPGVTEGTCARAEQVRRNETIFFDISECTDESLPPNLPLADVR